MLTDEQLGEVLGRELDGLVGDLSPRPGIADLAIHSRRSRRRRIGVAGAGTAAVAVAAASTLALASAGGAGSASSGHSLGRSKIHLASYRFALPRDATSIVASPADCALKATVASPDPSMVSGTDASQPAVASAVLAGGGCVSMYLTDPYDPSDPDAPQPAFPVLDRSAISIAGDQGTVGTYEFMGAGDTTNGQGVDLNGAKNVELTLDIPAAGGQQQLLLVAAAGVSEPQLESIVASGLQPTAAGR